MAGSGYRHVSAPHFPPYFLEKLISICSANCSHDINQPTTLQHRPHRPAPPVNGPLKGALKCLEMSADQSSPGAPPASAADRADPVARRARRPWRPEEDETLRERVAHYNSTRGTSWRWREIAQAIPGRTAKVRRSQIPVSHPVAAPPMR